MTTLCAPLHKPIFKSAAEARAALAQDGLGTVYHGAHVVWVATAFGAGTFSREEWAQSKPEEKQK